MKRFAFLLLLLPACQRPAGPAVHPVGGEVYYKGRPAAGATVFLHPSAGGRSYHGHVGPDGRFRITALVMNDGAPEGTYAVTLEWTTKIDADGREADGPDVFRGRYADRTRPAWTVEVRPGTNTIPRIDPS